MQYPIKFWRPFDNIVKYNEIRDFQYSGWGRYVFFASGQFDDWATYVCKLDDNEKLTCALPRDLSYFEFIVGLANTYGGNRVYDDVQSIFERVRSHFDKSLVDYIEMLSKNYDGHAEVVRHIYMWLYYAMRAEENKAGTKLGASIKFLAIHRILKENITIEVAEHEWDNAGAWYIREQCESRGIHWYGWTE